MGELETRRSMNQWNWWTKTWAHGIENIPVCDKRWIRARINKTKSTAQNNKQKHLDRHKSYLCVMNLCESEDYSEIHVASSPIKHVNFSASYKPNLVTQGETYKWQLTNTGEYRFHTRLSRSISKLHGQWSSYKTAHTVSIQHSSSYRLTTATHSKYI